MQKPLSFLLGLAVLAGAAGAMAGPNDPRWFRYHDDKGQPVVTDTVTPEHMARGYEELNSRMQPLRRVEGRRALTPEEEAAARAKREADAQRARDDKQLLRLYSAPADAERQRNRQLDALQVRVDFATNQLNTTRQRRAAEAQRAATFERKGKPVPAEIKNSIASLDKQLQGNQAELDAHKAEQAKVQAEFEPVIQRLAELTGKPVNPEPWKPAPPPPPKPAAKPGAKEAAKAPAKK